MTNPTEYRTQYNLPSLDKWVHDEFPQLLEAYKKTQGHLPEPDFEWAAFQTYRRYMEPDVWSFEKMLWHENGEPPVNPSNGPVVNLVAAGPIFRSAVDNSAHRIKGVTGFNLCDKYGKNQDIDSFLDKYNRSNRVRVFAYVPWVDVGWTFPSNELIKSFIGHCAEKGKAVSLCLLTDNDHSKVALVKGLISYLNEFDFPGLMLEAVNEPLTHDKIDPGELKNSLSGSKYFWGSGIYEDLRKYFGKVGYIHTPRDNEWPRKAKDSIECYRGGGPNFPDEPACRVPWILDEPIRPDQASFNILDFYTYGALGSLTSAGITFHSESGKLGNLPNDQEYACYNALMDGMNIFPQDAPLGNYEHLRDLEFEEVGNDQSPTVCLRIFRVGKYIVVVRNKSLKIPNNWKPLDNKQVCYVR